MIRLLAYMLFSIVLITLLRSVIGLLTRMFVQAVRASAAPRQTRPPPIAVNGELRKDPVCGTYVAIAGSPYKTIGQETFYFCSAACRGKFPGKA